MALGACDDAAVPAPATPTLAGSGAGGTSSGAGGAGGGGGEGATAGAQALGEPCNDDEACGAGLVCLRADADDPFLGGGPAGGMCTRACDEDADCPGEASRCLAPGPGGKCYRGCVRGEPPLTAIDDPLDPTKCNGRADRMCAPLPSGGGVCLPTCGKDEQCPPGRSCDARRSVCVVTPTQGLPSASPCDPDADVVPCAGRCTKLGSSAGAFCSEPCSFGGPLDGDDCGGLGEGLCLFVVAPAGPGDQAMCAKACSSHDDCVQSELLFCFDFSKSGSSGYCADLAAACDAVGQPCPPGPGVWPGSVCSATVGGALVCLDPTFPPPAGGAGGAGGG